LPLISGVFGDEDDVTGQWSHFVAVWVAGSGVDGSVQMFKNGAPGPPIGDTITLQDVGTLMLGCSVDAGITGPGGCFRGELAEVRIFNRRLSLDEIDAAYASNYFDATALQAWFRFSPPSSLAPDPLSTDPCQHQIVPITDVLDPNAYSTNAHESTLSMWDGVDSTCWKAEVTNVNLFQFEVQFEQSEFVSRIRYVQVGGVNAAAEVTIFADYGLSNEVARFEPPMSAADSLQPVFVDLAHPITGGYFWITVAPSTTEPVRLAELTLYTRPAQSVDTRSHRRRRPQAQTRHTSSLRPARLPAHALISSGIS